MQPSKIIQKIENYFKIKFDPAQNLLFFDEVQACGEALNSLKYFSEEASDIFVAAAGSLLGLTLNNVSFPVGKVEYLEIHPMNFEEFLQASGQIGMLDDSRVQLNDFNHHELIKALKYFLITGGAPEVVKNFCDMQFKNAIDFEALRKLQEDLINSHMSDMAKHCGNINSMHLDRIWRNIPEQLARENTQKFQFRKVIPKMNKYSQMSDAIDWLVTTGLVKKVYLVDHAELPLSAFKKENTFKLYIYDVGILGALARIHPQTILDYDFETFKGFFLENFVLLELQFKNVKNIFSWKSEKSEIDFLIEHQGLIKAVEVKAGLNTKSKSLSVFIQKFKTIKSYRLSLIQGNSKTESIVKLPLYLTSEILDN